TLFRSAVALIPPAFAYPARRVLAAIRSFAAREFSLTLRIGAVPVRTMTERNAAVLVGRYEPSPGNAYAVFLGNGVEQLELAVKERGDATLLGLSTIAPGEDDGTPP